MPPRRRRKVSRFDVRRLLARWSRPAVSVGVLAAGLLVSGAFVGVAVQETGVAREKRAAQEQIDAALARHSELEAAIAQRQTDTYVIDKARDLGYVRPGEGIVAVEGATGPQAVIAATVSDARQRLARWVALFFTPK